MPRLELQHLLRPTTTPEQEILLNWFYSQFDRGGAHRQILNVEPLFYQGTIVGTEFLTYANTKLYLTYNFTSGCDPTSVVTIGEVRFYDEADALSFRTNKGSILWSGAATRYARETNILKNFIFSRITYDDYNLIIFNGYRITLN